MAAAAVSFSVNLVVCTVLAALGAPFYFLVAVAVTIGVLIGLAAAL